MFGVINIIPKKGPNLTPLRLSGGYGSFNTKFASGAISLNSSNAFNASINLYYSKTDGRDFYFSEYDSPDNKNGHVDNLDGERKYGFYSSIRHKNLEISGMSSFRGKDVPSAPYEVDFGTNSPTTDIFNFAEAKYSYNISYDELLTARLYYDQYYFHGSYIYNGSSEWDKDNSKSLGSEIQYLWDISTNNRIIAGAEFKKIFTADYTSWDATHILSNFNFSFNKYALYFQDEYHFNKYFGCYLALRYDDYVKTGNKITPRITLVSSPDAYNTIKILWGTSFRMPTLFEKYYEAIESGYKMNPGLKTEDISTFEITWNNRYLNWIIYNSGLFYSHINNFINTSVSSEDNMTYYSNNGSINISGIKLDASITINATTGGYLRYAWQNSKDSEGNEVVNSPENLLKAGFYHSISYINASLEYIYEDSRLTYSNVRTKSFHLASLSLNNNKPYMGFTFSLKLNNLFNAAIQSPGGREHLQSYFIMPGRNYTFIINYELR
jgi:outer membrane cobalamin receptor